VSRSGEQRLADVLPRLRPGGYGEDRRAGELEVLHHRVVARHLGLQRAAVRSDILGGSASVTGQPFSLIDPILPLGYGFALVDDTGLVLFHSDKTKNGRENFREESDWSKELYAGTFGHSSQHSLRINYLGKDCRALMVPVPGVTQAPWSLIVFTDLTPERTVALQTMTMAATLLLSILVVPALLVAIWCLVRRPLFAPEWLWPNQHRMASYLYQICLYTLLIAAFLVLGFRGPIEQIVVACAAIPYSAMLMTLWCFRRYPSAADRARGRNAGYSAAAPMALTVLSAVVFLSLLIFHWSHLKALVILPVIVAIGAVPLLEGPRRYVATMVRYWRRADASGQKSSVRVFCIYGCGADLAYVDAPGEPIAAKKFCTSRTPTLSRHARSGGKVTMRHTEPPAGGSIVCGMCAVSVTPSMRAGVRSVTHTRAAL